MSGVWTEKSVPMTDHECAVEALEEIGATILASNQNQIRIRINGQEWAMQRSHGRYSIRINQRMQNSLNWMNNVGPVYEQAVQRKLRRLRTEEETAQLESDRVEIQAQREAFENQRLELIEQRKQEILEKAKTLGYRVKQTEQNGQIRMVLVRTA
jgi:phenylalanyl-tRNA synthetase alpha subunit